MNKLRCSHFALALMGGLLATQTAAAAVTVLTVPWVPGSPTTPHTTYAVNSTTETTIVLGAIVPSAVGSTDSFTVNWKFGDGTAATFALTNPYDISTTHQYPASAAVGTQWTAVVTVTDTTTKQTGSANYYVIQEENDTKDLNKSLQSRVNVAIDWGLWYMHQTMWRNSTTVGTKTIRWGGWDTQTYPCNNVNGAAYDCAYYGVVDAENVQAFEVNGHLANGPATDPYTDDVARGLARMTSFLTTTATLPNTYNFNPATATYTCKDGSYPTTSDPSCSSHGGQHFYNASAKSCTNPPCTYTFDGNKNNLMIYSNDGSGYTVYTSSPFLDALVASQTPKAVAVTGPVGETYADISQDIIDWYAYGQYEYSYDVSQGYTRGSNQSQGGAWLYGPQQGDDNSTSQWAAIAFISAQRGFGLSVPPIVTDANQTWVTNAQDVQDVRATGPDPYASGDNFGSYGYRGSFYYSNAWGPFAVTPSGMVQMAMDGVGRTPNKVFGDTSTAFDQRWNNTESYYADNFCNTTTNGAYYAPRAYIYGMYSFTKAMLLHNIGGSLSPINYLRTQTPNVFSGNPNVPPNSIDWYNALSAANHGKDACDGVAQTLVSYQQAPVYGSFDGHWYGFNYTGQQFPYETAWALIMLRQTVFVSCINNLNGAGSASGSAPPRVDLSWSNQAQSTSYRVLRGTANGGPYTQIGTTTKTSYSDTSGLVDGDKYFYVVQPLNGSTEVCQSNQATITVPNPGAGRH